MSQLEVVIAKIAAARSVNDLECVIRSLRSELRIANIVYHAVTIPLHGAENPILILTYEDEWVQRYIEKDYFKVDPVVKAGTKGFLPLDWSDVDRSSLEAQQFFREADAHHVGREGVTLPVRGPAGERALFTVTANLSSREWQSKRLLYMRDFQIIAHFVHDRAMELSGYRAQRPSLSGREVQCLELVAAGRHIKQVASELELSTSAVQLYLRSARTKLECSSVTEAAVKAAHIEIL